MKKVVLYFTRTGNSKRIAEKIAEKLECDTVKITDNVSWKGVLGFIIGGYYTITEKVTKITLTPRTNINSMDVVVLVSPVWADNITPAAYAFLLGEKKSINNLYLVINNYGSKVEKAYVKIEARVGSIENKYGITKKTKNEDEVILKVVSDINN